MTSPIKSHKFQGGEGTDAAVVLTFPGMPGRIIRLVHISASLSGGSASLDITGLQDGQTYSIDLEAGVAGAFFMGGGLDGVHADPGDDVVVTLGAAGATNVGKVNCAIVYDLPTKRTA